jgi:GT2 family glycosyltransferase
MTRRPNAVVLGLMTRTPVGGVVWQTLHYLVGLQRLGFDVHYVEEHGRAPGMLMTGLSDDGSPEACAFLRNVLDRVGLGGNWAYVALHSDGRCHGMDAARLRRLYASADVVLNLSGGTFPEAHHLATDRLVYVETDPVRPQVELADGLAATVDFLSVHCAHFTYAENYGRPQCALPVSERFTFIPTRQPVVLDFWSPERPPAPGEPYTTVGNWRQFDREVVLDGELYHWSKHEQFTAFLDLPAHTGRRFELALSTCDDGDRSLLRDHGWEIRDALTFSLDPDAYRAYIAASFGEFTVAKDQNVRLRTGWFSDRSATYLASGRPVVTQDTGFGEVLPTGEGLFAYRTLEEAAAAVEAIDADPRRHGHAALEIARACFDAGVVLGAMLAHLGIRAPARRTPVGAPRWPFPEDLDLRPLSRRPLVLAPDTESAIRVARPHRMLPPRRSGQPATSIVVVVHDALAVTKLALESILCNTRPDSYELVVVDNGSAAETAGYLAELAGRVPQVLLERHARNLGFPAGVNAGVAAAGAAQLVLLNNDVVVPPGWLDRLTAPLGDPHVGLVGAVTNRIGTGAEIETEYATYADFIAFAETRAARHRGRTSPLGMAAMFCLAMRRAVWEDLGPLDTGFGLGTLEDDDYTMRARAARLRVICAEDAFVHHFGEASFGALVSDGTYDALLSRNRRRFARRWGRAWEPYERRALPEYEALTARVVARLARSMPAGAIVLVATRGDPRLVDVDGCEAWHFPREADGRYAGHYPADGAAAVAHLDELRARGARFLVFPRSSHWWLEHYTELAAHLAAEHHEIHSDEDCVVFALVDGIREPAFAVPSREAL